MNFAFLFSLNAAIPSRRSWVGTVSLYDANSTKNFVLGGLATGFKGVTRGGATTASPSGTFTAKIWDIRAQKPKHVGTFATAEEAALAISRAKAAKAAGAKAMSNRLTPPVPPAARAVRVSDERGGGASAQAGATRLR